MKKFALICLFTGCFAAITAAQDIVHMKDGSRIACRVAAQSKDPNRVFYTLVDADTVNSFVPLKQVEYIERDGVNMIYNQFGVLMPLNEKESPIVPKHSVMIKANIGYAFLMDVSAVTWSANAVYYVKNVFGVGLQGQIIKKEWDKKYLISPYLEYRIPLRVQHFFYIGLAPGIAINPAYETVSRLDNKIIYTEQSINFGGRLDAGFDVRITRGFYFDCGLSWIGFGVQKKERIMLMGLYAGLRFGPEKRR